MELVVVKGAGHATIVLPPYSSKVVEAATWGCQSLCAGGEEGQVILSSSVRIPPLPSFTRRIRSKRSAASQRSIYQTLSIVEHPCRVVRFSRVFVACGGVRRPSAWP